MEYFLASDSSRPATIWRMWKGGAGLQPAFGLHRGRTGETACPTLFKPENLSCCGCSAWWYKRLGFKSEDFPPGFAILRRDEIEISRQLCPQDYGMMEFDVMPVRLRRLTVSFTPTAGFLINRAL